ncbi:conserved hypothetical protein [Streptomyces misionensis JCM 4497]
MHTRVLRATYRMGAGSGTVEALRTGLSEESPFQIMNACQTLGPSSPVTEGVEPWGAAGPRPSRQRSPAS